MFFFKLFDINYNVIICLVLSVVLIIMPLQTVLL